MLIVLIIIAVLVLLFIILYFYYNNREIALRKESEAQRGVIESVHDTMWKIIQQKAEVSDKYREAFEKIYPELIGGRYSNDQESMMKWITEDNPDFDTSLYSDLMQSIEVERTHFQNAQQRMLDVLRQRETLIEQMPAKYFISNKQKIEYEVISSTRTKSVQETRIDDDVTVFANKE
ncbi:MAG: hypothetical protein K5636_03705 [Bacteroidales bacterium]|nr:hypothetical protein [Bacteroidales bacterium]